MKEVTRQLEEDSKTLLNWVSNNMLKANPDKFHLLVNGDNTNISVNVDGYQIVNSHEEILLGVTIDNKLSFTEHISRMCQKASQKLHALPGISRYMNTDKRRIIMKAFINSNLDTPRQYGCFTVEP